MPCNKHLLARVDPQDLAHTMADIPPEYIQRRAAHIMRRLVGDPQFIIEEPGRQTSSGSMASILATLAADKAKPSDDSVYQVFEDTLVGLMMQPTVLTSGDGSRAWARTVTDLDIDYHPCEVLAEAAHIAGLSRLRFPHKTNVRTQRPYPGESRGYVSVSAGYRAASIKHYPVFMKDGQPRGWVMFALHGEDVEKLLTFIESTVTIGDTDKLFGLFEIEWV